MFQGRCVRAGPARVGIGAAAGRTTHRLQTPSNRMIGRLSVAK
jgi:hypothetical protein